jgi:hypothetical protein
VTLIAARAQVIQIQSKFWPNLNWNLVVCVKVAFALVEVPAQLFQDFRCGRLAESKPVEI